MDIKGVVGAWEELSHWDWHIYTIDTMYKTDNQGEPAVLPRELYYMLCADLNGKEIQEGGDICIHITDSLSCTVETNTAL